jgi:hypothetical protein
MALAFALTSLQDSLLPLDLAFLRTRVVRPYVAMLLLKHAFLPTLDATVRTLEPSFPWLSQMSSAARISWSPMW